MDLSKFNQEQFTYAMMLLLMLFPLATFTTCVNPRWSMELITIHHFNNEANVNLIFFVECKENQTGQFRETLATASTGNC